MSSVAHAVRCEAKDLLADMLDKKTDLMTKLSLKIKEIPPVILDTVIEPLSDLVRRLTVDNLVVYENIHWTVILKRGSESELFEFMELILDEISELELLESSILMLGETNGYIEYPVEGEKFTGEVDEVEQNDQYSDQEEQIVEEKDHFSELEEYFSEEEVELIYDEDEYYTDDEDYLELMHHIEEQMRAKLEYVPNRLTLQEDEQEFGEEDVYEEEDAWNLKNKDVDIDPDKVEWVKCLLNAKTLMFNTYSILVRSASIKKLCKYITVLVDIEDVLFDSRDLGIDDLLNIYDEEVNSEEEGECSLRITDHDKMNYNLELLLQTIL